jgi:hypothetical protein
VFTPENLKATILTLAQIVHIKKASESIKNEWLTWQLLANLTVESEMFVEFLKTDECFLPLLKAKPKKTAAGDANTAKIKEALGEHDTEHKLKAIIALAKNNPVAALLLGCNIKENDIYAPLFTEEHEVGKYKLSEDCKDQTETLKLIFPDINWQKKLPETISRKALEAAAEHQFAARTT